MNHSLKQYLHATWENFRAIALAGAIEIGLLALFFFLGQWGLLDIKTIVSVVFPEIGIGVFLYYFLGEKRRSRVEEVINLMDAAEKLRHLKVFTFSVLPGMLRVKYYFVENTTTKLAYEAPRFIEDMADRGIIPSIECTNKREMLKKISDDDCRLVPSQHKLLLVELETKK